MVKRPSGVKRPDNTRKRAPLNVMVRAGGCRGEKMVVEVVVAVVVLVVVMIIIEEVGERLMSFELVKQPSLVIRPNST